MSYLPDINTCINYLDFGKLTQVAILRDARDYGVLTNYLHRSRIRQEVAEFAQNSGKESPKPELWKVRLRGLS